MMPPKISSSVFELGQIAIVAVPWPSQPHGEAPNRSSGWSETVETSISFSKGQPGHLSNSVSRDRGRSSTRRRPRFDFRRTNAWTPCRVSRGGRRVWSDDRLGTRRRSPCGRDHAVEATGLDERLSVRL